MVKGTSRQRTSRLSFKLQERKKSRKTSKPREERQTKKERQREKYKEKKVRDNNQKQWRKVEDVLGIY
tara:strand:+ start:256 stop:459 length:204 start_codon:yes stop_codon:yes gene_type:complete